MTATLPVTAVVLAAGGGTRMRSRRAKVLHEIGGRSLIGHALAAVTPLAPERLIVVVGHSRDEVAPQVTSLEPRAVIAVQEEQRGTGHAVQVALDSVEALDPTVVVTYGDVPLLQSQTLSRLLAEHERSGAAISVITARPLDPSGYGRIVRDATGEVAAIVEEKDASEPERSIGEVNSGIFAFDAGFLRAALAKLTTDNAQGERYLTDVVAIARREGHGVAALLVEDVWQTEGVNDRVQLARVGAELNRRTLERWMRDGVTVVDPATTWVDVDAVLAPDATLLPGVQLRGATAVAAGAVIGPDTTLSDVTVGAEATVVRTHGSGAVIGERASVGPFAYLRPGTSLAAGAKVGTFVETKNAELEEGAKVPHLSYVGDASVGEGSNIGAGTIFANYDGVAKHHTRIGRHCRTGSDNVFVAPVEIGDGAATGAGAVVRRDVPPGALAVSTGAQRHIEDWVARKRAGTPAAEAAAAAQEAAAVRHTGTAGPASEETHP